MVDLTHHLVAVTITQRVPKIKTKYLNILNIHYISPLEHQVPDVFVLNQRSFQCVLFFLVAMVVELLDIQHLLQWEHLHVAIQEQWSL